LQLKHLEIITAQQVNQRNANMPLGLFRGATARLAGVAGGSGPLEM